MASIPDIFGTMAYGPAPEAAAPAQAWLDGHGRRFGLFIGGRWTGAGGETFETLNPATGKPLARLTQASAADVDRAVRGGAGGPARLVGARRPRAGALSLRHRAAGSRSTSRLFAVLETLDNGKPIRESRDIDVPLVARHFYHHAGWAQLMAARAAGPGAGRRDRPDHPLELPAADAGVEDRARAGDGEHGRAQARRVHLAHRAPFRGAVPRRSGCRPAW